MNSAASPLDWLRLRRGCEVRDTRSAASIFRVNRSKNLALREARLIVFYVPMHTATRLALQWVPAIRAMNSTAHLCACGLYAPLNESHLRAAGFYLGVWS